MQNRFSTRSIAICGLIAALYTAAGLAFAPLSFGPIQCRIAEALTILPVFGPLAALGLTLGCALTNAIGAALGLNILGLLDVLVGTAATGLAAWCSYLLRNVRVKDLPVLAPLPPIIINAVAIGAELAAVDPAGFSVSIFWVMAVQVAVGQFVACYLLGLPLYGMLKKTKLAAYLKG